MTRPRNLQKIKQTLDEPEPVSIFVAVSLNKSYRTSYPTFQGATSCTGELFDIGGRQQLEQK
jgi:hypothetical protein